MSNTHNITPLHLSGNATETQQEQLRAALMEASEWTFRTALKHLDRQNIGLINELESKLKTEIASAAAKIIERLTRSDKYKDEEAVSRREYPLTYQVRPIEAQVTDLRKIFPALGTCYEKIARQPLPDEAEGWFALPRWQAIAPTYGAAVEMVVSALAERRKLSNRILGKMGPEYLRQNERALLAESILATQQSGADILVIPAQTGLRHRGCSARRARVAMASHEFGLGAFASGCLLLTHPERLSHVDTLMIDCSGDEYSMHADGIYNRVPLFDYDLGGIEFSIFYEDRARNLWGTPSGFAVQISASSGKNSPVEILAGV